MRQITLLSNPEVLTATSEGPLVAFNIELDGELGERVSIRADEIGELIGFFCQIAEFAYENGALPRASLTTPIIGPMVIHGQGISLGTQGNDSGIVLVLDSPGARLGFRMTSKQLDELVSAMRPILLAAETPKTPRPN